MSNFRTTYNDGFTSKAFLEEMKGTTVNNNSSYMANVDKGIWILLINYIMKYYRIFPWTFLGKWLLKRWICQKCFAKFIIDKRIAWILEIKNWFFEEFIVVRKFEKIVRTSCGRFTSTRSKTFLRKENLRNKKSTRKFIIFKEIIRIDVIRLNNGSHLSNIF